MSLCRRYAVLLLALCATSPITLAQAGSAVSVPAGDYAELTSGAFAEGHVEHRTPVFKRAYLLVDSTRIELEDVHAYRTAEGYFRRIAGQNVGFARRIEEGRVDLYERSESHVNPMAMSGMPGSAAAPMTHSVNAGYFAKGAAEVQRVKYGTLRDALADNPESMRYLNQYRTLGIVQGGLAIGGLGLAVASLTQLEKGAEAPPPLLFVGAGIALTAWIPHLMRGGKLQDAIRAYND